MASRNVIKTGIGIIYFKYPDGSTIRCRATANRDVLLEHGIMPMEEEHLYDIDVKKLIPVDVLELESKVVLPNEDVDDRMSIDRFFQDKIKNLW